MFAISDLKSGLVIAIALLALLLGITDMVEKKVAANIEKASKAGPVGEGELKILNRPKDVVGQGIRSFGLSALLFFIQIVVDSSAYIPFLSSYHVFACGAVALGLVGGFYTALTTEFIHNPDFRTRINLGWMLLGLFVAIIDGMTVFLLILLYLTFETIPLVGRVFTLVLVPSIPSSILYLWAKWTEKSPLLRNVTYVLMLSPYLLLIALYFIVYTLVMI